MTRLKSFPNTKTPQNRYGYYEGKPKFPDLPERVSESSLAYFIGADSWFLFNLLKVPTDCELFRAPATNWNDLEEYNRVRNILLRLSVTNDAAERGVKLAEEKIGCSKKECWYQNALQVMEKDRKETPIIRKSMSN